MASPGCGTYVSLAGQQGRNNLHGGGRARQVVHTALCCSGGATASQGSSASCRLLAGTVAGPLPTYQCNRQASPNEHSPKLQAGGLTAGLELQVSLVGGDNCSALPVQQASQAPNEYSPKLQADGLTAGLQLQVPLVRGDDGPPRRHLGSHKFRVQPLASGGESHFLGDDALPCVVHLQARAGFIAEESQPESLASSSKRHLFSGDALPSVVHLRARGR